MTIWLVIQTWPGGKWKIAKGFFDEKKARYEAGELVGVDGAMISLATIDVEAPGDQNER